MTIKLVIGGFILHIISAYAPQAGLGVDEKRCFWEDLDEMMGGIPSTEKQFIGGDFNGHIGSISGGYDDMHGGCGFGDRDRGGVALLNFPKAFGLVVANSSFSKKEEHLNNYRMRKFLLPSQIAKVLGWWIKNQRCSLGNSTMKEYEAFLLVDKVRGTIIRTDIRKRNNPSAPIAAKNLPASSTNNIPIARANGTSKAVANTSNEGQA
ncbi:uncharacterized protein LOC132607885 [Lycium barbarum]|uniref:uncharacterized protein LOC132607885 n=1 Tax=Lycium barbarum TaxID=112863 RepID=UPI00293E0AE2|nr:uncharacterized protein LOC132607885 [Lycium barbarum]